MSKKLQLIIKFLNFFWSINILQTNIIIYSRNNLPQKKKPVGIIISFTNNWWRYFYSDDDYTLNWNK